VIAEVDRAMALGLAAAAGLESATEDDLALLAAQRRRVDAMAALVRSGLAPAHEPALTYDPTRI
jgi:hypothetical protein